jgi:tryptophan synthase alpha chain
MTFDVALQGSRSLLLPYMMCGVPDASATSDLFVAMADAGADGFEIGIPYADPLMDGPVIQEAGRRALEAGMTLDAGLDLAADVVRRTLLPCAVMTYVNPVLAMGLDRFAQRVSDAGAEAVIIADLPVDESEPFRLSLSSRNIGLVQFAAPTTTDRRLERVVAHASPFVYGVAEMGVTGERDGSSSRAGELVARIRSRSQVPVVLGVGISDPESAAAAAAVADGVIVGTALVRRVIEASTVGEACESVSDLVGRLVRAVHGASGDA